MMDDILTTVLAILIVAIIFVAVYYMWRFNRNLDVKSLLNDAVNKSKFNPTSFHIYDRSTDEICDRLIIVQPFEWLLWAINNSLYILNPEAGIKCSTNSVSAIQVDGKQFIETCLKLNLNSILQHYQRDRTPYIVNYSIETTTFTILSAINLLAREYITFNIADTSTNATPVITNKHTHYSKMNGFTTIALKELNAATKNKDGQRKINNETVVKLLCGSGGGGDFAHNTLIDVYRKQKPYTNKVYDNTTTCNIFIDPLTIEEIP